MHASNGLAWFPRKFDMRTAAIMFSDASNYAAAAVLGNQWTVKVFDGEFSWIRDKQIAFKELYAVLLGISTFAVPLRNRRLYMNIDNMAVHMCIKAGKRKDYDLNCLIRCLYYYASTNSIDYESGHVAGCKNIHADSLSRGRLDIFFLNMPNASPNMTRPCRVMTDF